jgi:hypothetical protein
MNARSVWLAVLLSAAVIVPRAAFIAQAHSESIDDEYHLCRGLQLLTRQIEGSTVNDPPLGQAISALPLLVVGCKVPADFHVLYGQRFSPETLLLIVAVWKAILFLPLVGVAFVWLRDVYNPAAAWMGVALLTFEPSFAAFIGSPSIDVIAVEAIFFASFAAWRYFARPSLGRLIIMITATAAAMLMKHTSIVLPVVIVIFALIWRQKSNWRHVLLALPVFLLAVWTLLLLDVSRPTPFKYQKHFTDTECRFYDTRLPAGSYIGSIISAYKHVDRGHPAFLLGENDKFGWWYYFPVVAGYKVPIPIIVVGIAMLISFLLAPPRWDEWLIIICFIAWSVFLMQSRLSIGFRHFLAPYFFLLMLLPRVMIIPGGGILWWLCVAAAAVHSVAFHPNYLSYVNFPRKRVWLHINDSNLDWGQGLKQATRWIDSHPEHRGRPIYIGFLPGPGGPHVNHHVGNRAIELSPHAIPPLNGIVILSPMWVVGTYHPVNRYELLQQVDPIDVIGGSMLVYDLDRIRRWKRFARPKPSTLSASGIR